MPCPQPFHSLSVLMKQYFFSLGGKALPLYDPELVSVVVLRGEESIPGID